ncbi:MAG: hypothetical protein ACYS9T_11385, partial [Planctomycetota bacterium]
MSFDLRVFGDPSFDSDYVDWLVDARSVDVGRHFGRLWDYYANPICEAEVTGAGGRRVSEAGRCYVQAQEYGLPCRITGLVHRANAGVFGGRAVQEMERKEVVIENDIAWRTNASVDFLFGKPVSFVSKSPARDKRVEIESI